MYIYTYTYPGAPGWLRWLSIWLTLDFGSGHDPRVVRSSPVLAAWSLLKILSLPLPLPLPPTHVLFLSKIKICMYTYIHICLHRDKCLYFSNHYIHISTLHIFSHSKVMICGLNKEGRWSWMHVPKTAIEI